MKKALTILIAILAAALVLFAAALFLIPETVQTFWQQAGLPPGPLMQMETLTGQVSTSGETRLYGTLEARTTHAMSEMPGRAIEVLVAEGDEVTAGAPLIHLDPTDVKAQIAAAEEAVTAAEAARNAVAAPPDESIVAAADSAVDAARTEVENARRTLKQAQDVLANPLSIDAQVKQTAALIPVAKANVDTAEAAVKQLDVLINDARSDGSREGKYKVQILEAQKAAAQEELNAANARLNGLYSTLALLKKMKQEPIALEANVHQAENQVKLAEAGLEVAQAERDARTAPPQPEAIAVAEAGVQKARAALDLARWQEDKLTVIAPASGRVQMKLVEAGEVVQPGQPLITIADTSRIELWAYVAQSDLHRVHLNDRLPVEVLAIPDHRFEGEVFFIASQAQFRPSNVLNPDDRGDMVFLIKLTLDNQDGQLKPGMPADVILP